MRKIVAIGLTATTITSIVGISEVKTAYVEAQAKEEQQKLLQLEIEKTEDAKLKILEEESLKVEAKLEEERKEMQRISSVTFDPYDIRIVSNLKTSELREVFENIDSASSMVNLAPAFIDAERVYGVNALALAGIVALESSWNTSRRAIDQYNLTGYAVYSDCSNGRDFLSPYDCIMETARLLKKDYLSTDGKWHNGFSVKSINIMYSSDNSWYTKVSKIGSNFLNEYHSVISEG